MSYVFQKHPAIPTDCEYFVLRDGEWFFNLPPIQCAVYTATKEERRVIGAIAHFFSENKEEWNYWEHCRWAPPIPPAPESPYFKEDSFFIYNVLSVPLGYGEPIHPELRKLISRIALEEGGDPAWEEWGNWKDPKVW